MGRASVRHTGSTQVVVSGMQHGTCGSGEGGCRGLWGMQHCIFEYLRGHTDRREGVWRSGSINPLSGSECGLRGRRYVYEGR